MTRLVNQHVGDDAMTYVTFDRDTLAISGTFTRLEDIPTLHPGERASLLSWYMQYA